MENSDKSSLEANTMKEIVSFVGQLESLLISSEGEITEEMAPLLVLKEVNLPEKVDSYYMMMDRMEFVSMFYKQKAEAFLKMAKAAERIIENCENNLYLSMKELQVDELKGNDFRFILKNNPPSVQIDNEELIDAAYRETIPATTVIRKKKIADDLKLGVPVAGAQLVTKQSIKMSLNSPGKRNNK